MCVFEWQLISSIFTRKTEINTDCGVINLCRSHWKHWCYVHILFTLLSVASCVWREREMERHNALSHLCVTWEKWSWKQEIPIFVSKVNASNIASTIWNLYHRRIAELDKWDVQSIKRRRKTTELYTKMIEWTHMCSIECNSQHNTTQTTSSLLNFFLFLIWFDCCPLPIFIFTFTKLFLASNFYQLSRSVLRCCCRHFSRARKTNPIKWIIL